MRHPLFYISTATALLVLLFLWLKVSLYYTHASSWVIIVALVGAMFVLAVRLLLEAKRLRH